MKVWVFPVLGPAMITFNGAGDRASSCTKSIAFGDQESILDRLHLSKVLPAAGGLQFANRVWVCGPGWAISTASPSRECEQV